MLPDLFRHSLQCWSPDCPAPCCWCFDPDTVCSPEVQTALPSWYWCIIQVRVQSRSTDCPAVMVLMYDTGTVCSPEVQTALPALRLPLNLAAAATTGGAPHTPRYIYATNPRTGQLLILSSVGELGGAQALQQQQLQLQQQQVDTSASGWLQCLDSQGLYSCSNSR